MAFASMVIRQQQPLTPTSPSIPTSISPAPDKIPPLPLNHTAESMVTQAGASDDTTATVIQVLSTERAALANLERIYQTERLARENIDRAVSQIVSSVNRGGKLIVCGVGKSGRVGRKVEATMNSMGIYSVFLHPTEALHGDLGMIRSMDTVLLISFSGRTPELMLLLPHLPSAVPIIAITAHMDPTTCPLFTYHDPQMAILLPAPIHIDEEASFGVSAPTTSTTVALALGDALAIATARRLHTTPGRGPAEVFKGFHPGGAIGAALSVSTPRSVPTPTSASPLSALPPVDYVHVKRNDHKMASSSSVVADQQFGRSISDLAIPLHKIPTVTSSRIRILDILITAIQHPASKSWVKLSPTEIIPPRRVRSLSQESHVTSAIADLTSPVCIGPDGWLCVPASATVGHVHHWLTDGTKGDTSLPLVCVMDDTGHQGWGFVEGEDVCGIAV